MKTFIYTITVSKQQTNGGRKQTAAIYRVKRNKPYFVSEVTWNTAGYRGERHEVMNKIISLGLLPKKDYGYFRTNNKYDIYEV